MIASPDTGPMRAMLATGLVSTIEASARFGLLDALDQPRSARELAQALELDARAVGLALDVLVAVGYLQRDAARYSRRVAPGSWPDAGAFLDSGEVAPYIDQRALRGAEYSKHVLFLAEMHEACAQQLAHALAPARSIADVGAGSGVFSLAMAQRSDDAHVTLIDLPEVVAGARGVAEQRGLGQRVDAVGADWLAAEPRGPFDRVVLANVLHLEDEAGAARLVAHWAERVTPTGELIVVDNFLASSQRQLALALYALHLGMRTRRGRPHEKQVLQRICHDAGLTDQRVVPLDCQGTALAALVCRRPDARSVQPGEARPTREQAEHDELATLPRGELEALRSSIARLRRRSHLVFDGARDAIMVISHATDQLVAVNRAFRALFDVDWPPEQARDYGELFAPADRPRFRALLADIRGGRVRERGRYHFTMVSPQTGARIDAELTGFDPSHSTTASFIVRDRAELAQHERLEAIGALAGAVAHDINTPLGVLRSDASSTAQVATRLRRAAERGEDPTSLHERLEETAARMTTACQRIEAMVERISAFANLEGAALKQSVPRFVESISAALCERASAAARTSGE